MTSSPGPYVEIDIEEEMNRSYVEAYRTYVDEKTVPKEKLVAAIKFLSKLKGGIETNRGSAKLFEAVEHISKNEGKTDEEILESFQGFEPSPLEYDICSQNKEQPQKQALEQERQQRRPQMQETLSLWVEKFENWGEYFAHVEDLLDKRICRICLSNDAEIMFEPCRHVAACQDCVDQLQNLESRNECPFCRESFRKTTKVYIV